jgi:GGDEF domain-containing protein
VTVSIGIATACAEDAADPERLFSHSDNALYRAKTLGRDRAEIFQEKKKITNGQ